MPSLSAKHRNPHLSPSSARHFFFYQVNAGTCAGYFNFTACVCPYPMTGAIALMPEPMPSEWLATTNFSAGTVAAGAAMFVVTTSLCPDDKKGRLCGGVGTCNTASGTCSCPASVRGPACDVVCPVGLSTDPLGSNATGLICSGNGICDATGSCVCTASKFSTSTWFGTRCQLECPQNGAGLYCSDHGTCAYDASVQSTPYCKCFNWDTGATKDSMGKRSYPNSEAKSQCDAFSLYVQDDGHCSFYGPDGYAACYSLGQCGACENGARRLAPPALLALLALVACMWG